jgi:hypothetical protein
MSMRIRSILTLLALSLACTSAAQAARDPAEPFHDWSSENETGQFSYDDSNDKPWQEDATKLPPLPEDTDLLPVQLDSLAGSLQAYIGGKSLSSDPEDRVLRFWLVIRSPAGGYNASFEGLRCEVSQYKVYAYGNPRRKPPVRLVPQATWQPVGPRRPGTYRPEMMKTLLCNESGRPRQVSDILDTLRGLAPYRNPSAENYDY